MTSISGPCGSLDGDLGWALGAVFRTYLKLTGEALADMPGGPRGYQVLAAAGDLPGTQLALAQRLGLDRTVMTYLLDDLERAGLVERRPDPADRRARRVTATAAGRTRLDEAAARLGRCEEELLAALGPDDRVTLRALLQRLATAGGAAPDVGEMCRVAEQARATP